jgi:hypothetical protein
MVQAHASPVAISTFTKSVFYFGEDEAVIVNGSVTGEKKRGWRAGEGGASFGLIMPGTPLLGARYQQENAPGNTMDRAECVGVSQSAHPPHVCNPTRPVLHCGLTHAVCSRHG